MDIENKLRFAGLSGNESKLYLELWKRGSINASSLAKQIGFDRALTYQLLNNLVEKGLANYIIKENKKYFSASNPENLLEKAKEHESFIAELVGEINKIKKIVGEKQDLEVYEGKSGLRVLFNEIYNTKDICFFGATGGSYETLKYEMPHIANKIIKRGIKGRGITDIKFKDEPFTKLINLQIRYLENVESHNSVTTITDDGRVAIHCLAEKPLVIIIKNKFLAETYKNYFEVLWKVAKP